MDMKRILNSIVGCVFGLIALALGMAVLNSTVRLDGTAVPKGLSELAEKAEAAKADDATDEEKKFKAPDPDKVTETCVANDDVSSSVAKDVETVWGEGAKPSTCRYATDSFNADAWLGFAATAIVVAGIFGLVWLKKLDTAVEVFWVVLIVAGVAGLAWYFRVRIDNYLEDREVEWAYVGKGAAVTAMVVVALALSAWWHGFRVSSDSGTPAPRRSSGSPSPAPGAQGPVPRTTLTQPAVPIGDPPTADLEEDEPDIPAFLR